MLYAQGSHNRLALSRLWLEPGGNPNFDPTRILDIVIFMSGQEIMISKKRGPKATGWGTPVLVRLQPADLSALDTWISRQEAPLSRPEAIRVLVRQALG